MMTRKKITPVEPEEVAPVETPIEEPEPEPEEVAPVEKIYIVPLANLQNDRIVVVDGAGRKYRLSPAVRSGEYVLMPVPEV